MSRDGKGPQLCMLPRLSTRVLCKQPGSSKECVGGSYQGHTKNPSSSCSQKHQFYVISGNTGLRFRMARATGVARRRRVACNQQLQPSEVPTLYFRRIRRAGVYGWAYRCGLGITTNCDGVPMVMMRKLVS